MRSSSTISEKYNVLFIYLFHVFINYKSTPLVWLYFWTIPLFCFMCQIFFSPSALSYWSFLLFESGRSPLSLSFSNINFNFSCSLYFHINFRTHLSLSTKYMLEILWHCSKMIKSNWGEHFSNIDCCSLCSYISFDFI